MGKKIFIGLLAVVLLFAIKIGGEGKPSIIAYLEDDQLEKRVEYVEPEKPKEYMKISQGDFLTIDTRGLNLSQGIVSDQVKILKDFFRQRQESNVSWGYLYDTRTSELVSNYQREKGLSVDGRAGPKTIESINKDIRHNKYRLSSRYPKTKLKGDMIIINKSSNTLYHMKEGLVYKRYPVATGKTPRHTPNGRHKIVNKLVNPAWGGAGINEPVPAGAKNNPLGRRWIGLSYGGGGQYGIHGNSQPSSIGRYISLGCVRMFNNQVESMFEEVKIGNPVWIGDEATLISYGVVFEEEYKEPVVESYEIVGDIKLRIDGRDIPLSKPIVNRQGKTYYPFREILENANVSIHWNQEDKSIQAMVGNYNILLWINSNIYIDNGIKKAFPKGEMVFVDGDNNSYIPIRTVMEALGFQVIWNGEDRVVNIKTVKNF